jgi:hypothetical protein
VVCVEEALVEYVLEAVVDGSAVVDDSAVVCVSECTAVEGETVAEPLLKGAEDDTDAVANALVDGTGSFDVTAPLDDGLDVVPVGIAGLLLAGMTAVDEVKVKLGIEMGID